MMTISSVRCTCGSCQHVFDAEVVANAPLAVSIASMESIRCPKCGSDKCGLGGSYDSAAAVTGPIEHRIRWWRDYGERGISSNTIFSAFMGYRMVDACYPFDPDDFRRCKQLLDLIPEWRSDLGKVSTAYPWFAPMIEAWDEIESLFVEEVSKGRIAPKCYERMQVARELCEAIKKS